MYKTVVVVGRSGSGKGSVASMLKEKGYKHFSASSEVKKDVEARRLPQTRPYYSATSTLSRLELGNDIYARYFTDTITQWRNQGTAGNVVIDGPRHPDEVTYLKDTMDAFVIWVGADDEERFERAKNRKREIDGDNITPEHFFNTDAEDRGVNQLEYGSRVDDCRSLADVIIENNGTLHDLQEKIDSFTATFGVEGGRRSKER